MVEKRKGSPLGRVVVDFSKAFTCFLKASKCEFLIFSPTFCVVYCVPSPSVRRGCLEVIRSGEWLFYFSGSYTLVRGVCVIDRPFTILSLYLVCLCVCV